MYNEFLRIIKFYKVIILHTFWIKKNVDDLNLNLRYKMLLHQHIDKVWFYQWACASMNICFLSLLKENKNQNNE